MNNRFSAHIVTELLIDYMELLWSRFHYTVDLFTKHSSFFFFHFFLPTKIKNNAEPTRIHARERPGSCLRVLQHPFFCAKPFSFTLSAFFNVQSDPSVLRHSEATDRKLAQVSLTHNKSARIRRVEQIRGVWSEAPSGSLLCPCYFCLPSGPVPHRRLFTDDSGIYATGPRNFRSLQGFLGSRNIRT